MKIRKFLRSIVEFFIGSLNERKNYTGNDNPVVPVDDLADNYLFDFKNWGTNQNGPVAMFIDSNSSMAVNKKIKVKPIDVLTELETVPTPFSLNLLDEKIQMLQDKEKIIRQQYAKREMTYLIERLQNRKKYADTQSFFDKFQNTTEEKIAVLLEKYDLVMKPSDIFIPEFPEEAINVMRTYIDKLKEVTGGKSPVFYVIATADSFKQNYGKRDPILLVQSPFGFYYQILGAWDKEMLILSEL